MKDSTEQTEVSVSKIGKFNSPDDLLAAYNALESEFTKRCQLIKQLQAAQNSDSVQADEPSEQAEITETAVESAQPPKPQSTADERRTDCDCTQNRAEPILSVRPSAPNQCEASAAAVAPQRAEITERDILSAVEARAIEYAEALCEIPEVFDAAVARYKQKLLGFGGSVASPQGTAVVTPAKRPKTLSDAKRLADEMLA